MRADVARPDISFPEELYLPRRRRKNGVGAAIAGIGGAAAIVAFAFLVLPAFIGTGHASVSPITADRFLNYPRNSDPQLAGPRLNGAAGPSRPAGSSEAGNT
jgi:hypothetical protein